MPFILLYRTVFRPCLEYANMVWCPYKKADIDSKPSYNNEVAPVCQLKVYINSAVTSCD